QTDGRTTGPGIRPQEDRGSGADSRRRRSDRGSACSRVRVGEATAGRLDTNGPLVRRLWSGRRRGNTPWAARTRRTQTEGRGAPGRRTWRPNGASRRGDGWELPRGQR